MAGLRRRARLVVGWAVAAVGLALCTAAVATHASAVSRLGLPNAAWLSRGALQTGNAKSVLGVSENFVVNLPAIRETLFLAPGFTLQRTAIKPGRTMDLFIEETNSVTHVAPACVRSPPHRLALDVSLRHTVVQASVHSAWLWGLGLPLFAGSVALRWRSRRRRRKGACKACGYTLAGLHVGASCPECGDERKGQAP